MGDINPSASVLFTALSCFIFGVIVLARHRRKATHQAFMLLTLNLSVWAACVFAVTQSSDDLAAATFWVTVTEIVACFIPASIYTFIVFFPKGRFDGSRGFLITVYVWSLLLAASNFTPWYIVGVFVEPGALPRSEHGPLFVGFTVLFFVTVVVVYANLRRKLSHAVGIDRRQIQYVMFGTFFTIALGGLSIVPLDNEQIQAFTPLSLVFLLGIFSYAMIRFHLLDTRVLLSRFAVLMVGTVFVMTLLTGFMLVGGIFEVNLIAPVLLATLIIVLCLQSVENAARKFVDGTLLKHGVDVNRMYTRIAELAAEEVQFDELLNTVAEEIKSTLGVRTVRVLMLDEEDPSILATVFTTNENDEKIKTREHGPLIAYLRAHPDPLLLEKILHRRPSEEMARIARHLAELEAFFCLPLKTSAGLVGIMTLGQKDTHDIYSEIEVLAFSALRGPLGTAIANAKLYRELEHLNLHLSSLFRHMREGVVSVDNQGRVTAVNEAAKKILGDIETGQPSDALTPEVAEVLDETLRRQRPVRDFECEIVDPEGETVPVIMSASCLRTPGNGVSGAVALIYDLSQVKILEENVIRADRLSSIGTLAAGMAHEIKNPLVSIKTFTQLLLNRYNDPDFRETFKDVVPHEVDRIDTIVTRLLDFARPRPVAFDEQNIRKIVEEVLALVENQIHNAGVSLSTSFPEEDLEIIGDEQQLHQVFLNLVLNAVEAMENCEDATLRIEAQIGHMRLRSRGVPGMAETECVRIVVSDSGCGIAAESLQDLFTPFFTTKAEGCGLGLAVVHGIVEEHNGHIDVTSTPGEGTTFCVALPLAGRLESTEIK